MRHRHAGGALDRLGRAARIEWFAGARGRTVIVRRVAAAAAGLCARLVAQALATATAAAAPPATPPAGARLAGSARLSASAVGVLAGTGDVADALAVVRFEVFATDAVEVTADRQVRSQRSWSVAAHRLAAIELRWLTRVVGIIRVAGFWVLGFDVLIRLS